MLTLLRCDTTLARLDSDMMDGIGLSGPGQESDRELIWEGGLARRLRISKLSDSKQPDNQYPLSSAINSVPCLNNSNNTVVQLPQIHRRNSRYEISRANDDPALYIKYQPANQASSASAVEEYGAWRTTLKGQLV